MTKYIFHANYDFYQHFFSIKFRRLFCVQIERKLLFIFSLWMWNFNKKKIKKKLLWDFFYEIQLFFWWKSVPGSPRTNVKNILSFSSSHLKWMEKYSQVTGNYQDEKLLISWISFFGKWGKIPSCQSEKWGNGKVFMLFFDCGFIRRLLLKTAVCLLTTISWKWKSFILGKTKEI